LESTNRKRTVQLHPSWLQRLEDQFDLSYMQQLRAFLQEEKNARKTIYPPGKLFFNALDQTPYENTRVVIVGQDPYHAPGQAHGLSFSVPAGAAPPPSLVNIFKEIEADLGIPPPDHGCLESWAQQGVLLLNSVLSVARGSPGSHRGKGWELFTDRIIALLSEEAEPCVFLLWGNYAKRKGQYINCDRHQVLTATHPSPFSERGFFGCRHFSKANQWLKAQGRGEIDRSLPPSSQTT